MRSPIRYKFLAPEGAVLQLPEGASIFEARNINDLRDLAVRHARSWYEYVAANISRDLWVWAATSCGMFRGHNEKTHLINYVRSNCKVNETKIPKMAHSTECAIETLHRCENKPKINQQKTYLRVNDVKHCSCLHHRCSFSKPPPLLSSLFPEKIMLKCEKKQTIYIYVPIHERHQASFMPVPLLLSPAIVIVPPPPPEFHRRHHC